MTVLTAEPVKRRRGRPPGSKTRKPAKLKLVPPAAPLDEAPKPGKTRDEPRTPEISSVAVLGETPVNWMGRAMGFVLGAFVPIASYTIVHLEATEHQYLWVLVLGGLIYSALTVYQWAYKAFHFRLKAVGFVVLLEGAMTFSQVRWLGLAGLAILVLLNGVSAARSLAGD